MLDNLFYEVALVLMTAGVFSLIAFLLRQPLIVAYLLTGLVVGPSVFNFTHSPEIFGILSQIGIAFLLFLVGLNLNWRKFKEIGSVALFAGTGQVLFTSGVGYLIIRALGYSFYDSVFMGVAFAFSSTIIVVKMLSDKRDLDRLYGRITLGMLIVQDIIALTVLIVLAGMHGGQASLGDVLLISILKGAALIAGLVFLSQYVLLPLFSAAAKQQELLFILAISWCFVVSTITLALGFGIEIGALFAGISLSGSRYHTEVEHKIRPLRDFFLIIFFIMLGTHLTPDISLAVVKPAMIISAFVLIGNPLLIIFILRAFGYHPRTGFLVGSTMGQISEFSFIVLTAGIATGLASPSLIPLATIICMVTITISTYFIKYNEVLYQKLSWAFNWMAPKVDDIERSKLRVHDTVLIGYEGLGQSILDSVKTVSKNYIVVDFDPWAVQHLSQQEEPVVYGDAGNEDFLEEHQVHRANMVICTVADKAVNRDVLNYLSSKQSKAITIVTARTNQLAQEYYDAGATFVINPDQLGGHSFAKLLKDNKTKKLSWAKSGKALMEV